MCVCLATGSQNALADPIYVIREKDGVVRFTNKAPAAGVKAEVFTARGVPYSITGGGGARYSFTRRGYFSDGKLYKDAYNEFIQKASRQYQVDAALIKAIIHVESAFNANAVSPKGAQGLMQLMPDTARMHGVLTPFEPQANIEAGTRHIAMLLKKYSGNQSYALAAYNAGEEAVEQYGGIPPYDETRQYVKKVQILRDRYNRQG